VRDPRRRRNGSMVRPKGDRGAAVNRKVEPVSRHAVRDPCRMPNGSVRPKGDKVAAAPTEPVSRLLNLNPRYALHAVRDPRRRPNGSVRLKGDRGAAVNRKVEPVSRQAVRDPCRMPKWLSETKRRHRLNRSRETPAVIQLAPAQVNAETSCWQGGGIRQVRTTNTRPMPFTEWLSETKGRQ
jgi:hypothetical protein